MHIDFSLFWQSLRKLSGSAKYWLILSISVNLGPSIRAEAVYSAEKYIFCDVACKGAVVSF